MQYLVRFVTYFEWPYCIDKKDSRAMSGSTLCNSSGKGFKVSIYSFRFESLAKKISMMFIAECMSRARVNHFGMNSRSHGDCFSCVL